MNSSNSPRSNTQAFGPLQLSKTQPGKSYIISHLDSEPSEVQLKLLALGVLPGSEIRVERVASAGKTLYVIVNGNLCLALRKQETQQVFVTPMPAA